MFHYLYKITRADGAYYIGIHSTSNLDDDYFGSGTRLSASVKKHGKSYHTKEILEWFETREEAEQRESALVTEDTIKDPQCLNLVPGGKRGPNQHLLSTKEKIGVAHKGKKKSTDHCKAISEKLKGQEKTKKHCQKLSAAQKTRLANGATNPWAGDQGSKMSTKKNLDRVANGTNPWAGELGSANSRKIAAAQVAENRHPFQQQKVKDAVLVRCNQQIADGTHPFLNLQKLTCCFCGKSGSAPNMRRWHFDNCKSK
jgi:hypothetical protein